jgi:hypothetical protein
MIKARKYEFCAPLLGILLLSLAARLYYLFDYHEVWWDSAVYIEMGKYLFSFGKSGLWEPIRPVLWPFFLGLLWSVKLDVFLLGRAVLVLLSLGIIYLVYKITSTIFSGRAGLIAAALFSFSSIFFLAGFHLYTEIPSTFFLLLSILFMLKGRLFWSGILFACSVLTKFTMLLYAVPIIVFLTPKFWRASWTKKIGRLLNFGFGALVGLMPYFALNFIMYRSFLLPLIEANRIILRVVGCNLLWYKPWYYYFQIIFEENVLYLLVPLGIATAFRNYTREKLLAVLCFVVPLVYFTQLHCRDYRYLVTFLPFAAVCASAFVDWRTKKLGNWFFYSLLAVIFVLSSVHGLGFYKSNEVKSGLEVQQGYYHFLENKSTSKEILVSNPVVGVHTDARVYPVYYPVYDGRLAQDFYGYVQRRYRTVGYVFLDSCGGGIICPPSDRECFDASAGLLGFLREKFKLVYDKEYGGCTYYIFESSTT